MGQGNSLMSQLKKDNGDYQKMQDAVRTLHKEIESENDNFKTFVLTSGNEAQKYLPVTAMLKYRTFVDQKATDSIDEFKDKITNLVEQTLEGNSSTGSAVAETLKLAASTMLANAVMGHTRKTGYTISVGMLGGVQRVDYLLSNRTFTSSTWKSTMKTVVSGCIIVSSVNIETLNKNVASVLVQNCFKGNSANVQIAIRKLLLIEKSGLPIKERHQKIQKVYDTLPDLLAADDLRPPPPREVRKMKREALKAAALAAATPSSEEKKEEAVNKTANKKPKAPQSSSTTDSLMEKILAEKNMQQLWTLVLELRNENPNAEFLKGLEKFPRQKMLEPRYAIDFQMKIAEKKNEYANKKK